jgi:group I intron endonuclease
MDKPYGVIYLLTNTVNGKPYVGQAKVMWQRWKAHCTAARRDCPLPIHRALRKYGDDAFSLQVIECDVPTKERLDELETAWIFLMDSKAPNGYNLTNGGEGSAGCPVSELTRQKHRDHRHSPKARKKISEANSRREWTTESLRRASEVRKGKPGNPCSEESRQKISNAKKGYKHSRATCRKISLAKKGQGLGKHPSEETRQKLCAAQHHHPVSDATRRKISCANKRHFQAHPERRIAISKVHKGKNISPENREAVRKAQLGRKHTDAELEKMRGPRTGNALENVRAASKARWERYYADPDHKTSWTGKHLSEEHKQKCSLAAKARWADPKQRRKLTSTIQRG